MNDQDIEKYYKLYGTNSFKFRGNFTREINDLRLAQIAKTLDFTNHRVSVLGIFAGFGFTAISYVKNPIFFLTGELLLIGGGLFINYD